MFIFTYFKGLTIDNSVYLTNIYSGNVIKVNHKNADDLQYYYRRSSIPSKYNEYIYDYTYSRIEGILRMLIGKYERINILNKSSIHKYEICYDFYKIYFPNIISFQNISNIIMKNIISNKNMPLEFWLDKIHEFSDTHKNKNYYLEVIGLLFQYSPFIDDILNYCEELYSPSYNGYYMNFSNIFCYILQNHQYINSRLYEKIINTATLDNCYSYIFLKSICNCKLPGANKLKLYKPDILKMSKTSEYNYYSNLSPDNIDINECIYFIDNNPDLFNHADRYGFISENMLQKTEEYDIQTLQSVISKIVKPHITNNTLGLLFTNKKLSREIITDFIMPELIKLRNVDINTNLRDYEDTILAHPNIYLQDLELFGINIYECEPDNIILNPNTLISNKEMFDRIVFAEDCGICNLSKYLSNSKITESDIDYFLDLYTRFNLTEHETCSCNLNDNIFGRLTKNPNMNKRLLKRIIEIIKIDKENLTLSLINWLSIFNNPDIPIKYIEKVFRNNPDLFA